MACDNEFTIMGVIHKVNKHEKIQQTKTYQRRRKRQHPLPGAFNGKPGKYIDVGIINNMNVYTHRT